MTDATQQVLKFKESLSFIQKAFGEKTPDYTLVLGSGLNDVIDTFEIKHTLSYSDIPNFPKSHLQGHSGKLHLGMLHGKSVLIFSGRYHHYQGYPNTVTSLPAWISGFWKIPTFITTNASGGINTSYKMGDMSLIKDHIFLQVNHPLNGVMLPEWENPFVDMTTTYDEKLRKTLLSVAEKNNIQLHEGVYVCVTGPTYETPAEIKMFRQMGGDMVGMSTIPEVMVARAMKMQILGISMVANMAAGITKDEIITHQDVVDSIKKTQGQLCTLLSEWLKS
jgi:purine-nucleoside phosphorylase